MDYADNIFRTNDAVIAASKKWVASTGAELTIVATSLLFMADENEQSIEVTIWENRVL